ncbi:MAG: type II secretion system protein [Patescibacteria group bacterium]
MAYKYKNSKGFTLIELLVVIAIIGLLSTLSVVALNTSRARSRDARRLSDIKQIQTSIEMYYAANNHYPERTTGDGLIGIYNGSGYTYYMPVSSNAYMSTTPTPPMPLDGACVGLSMADKYYYAQTNNGTSYIIRFCLGSKTGDVKAGFNNATPTGISSSPN